MKKYMFIVLLGLMTVRLFGQYTDVPTVTVRDTLYDDTRVTRDFYFNSENSFTSQYGQVILGPIDLNVKTSMASTDAGDDSVTIEVYGIVRKVLPGTTTWSTTYTDSHRVAIIAPVDSLMKSYPIDPLWANFPLFDGLQFVWKKAASDADSTIVDSNIRIWGQGEQR